MERKQKRFIKGLKDGRWYIRKRCVLALRLCDPPDRDVFAALCRTVLDDPDAEVRWTAARVLGDLHSDDAIPALLIAAEDKNRRVRKEAVESIELLRSGIGDD